jgi:hypothetical protein
MIIRQSPWPTVYHIILLGSLGFGSVAYIYIYIKESSALLFCCMMELDKTQAFVMINWTISAETSVAFSSTANTLVNSLQENLTFLDE